MIAASDAFFATYGKRTGNALHSKTWMLSTFYSTKNATPQKKNKNSDNSSCSTSLYKHFFVFIAFPDRSWNIMMYTKNANTLPYSEKGIHS